MTRIYSFLPSILRPAPVIDPEILDNMKMKQFIGHAPKPGHMIRNQVPYDLSREYCDVPESPMMRGGYTCIAAPLLTRPPPPYGSGGKGR